MGSRKCGCLRNLPPALALSYAVRALAFGPHLLLPQDTGPFATVSIPLGYSCFMAHVLASSCHQPCRGAFSPVLVSSTTPSDSFERSVLSFHFVGPRDQIQVWRPESLYSELSHSPLTAFFQPLCLSKWVTARPPALHSEADLGLLSQLKQHLCRHGL